MTTPRRHHYLPASYQERWLSPKTFFLRECKTGRIRRATPPNTGVERDYYKIVFGSGASELGVEEILSDVESRAKDVTDALLAGKTPTELQRYELAYFVAFLVSRVPQFMENFDRSAAAMLKNRIQAKVPNATAAAEWLARQPDLPAQLQRYTPEQVVRMLHGESYRIKVPPAYRILASVRAALSLGPELGALHWELGMAPPGSRFITSDNPVQLGVTWHRSLPIGATTYLVPLAPTLMLKTGLPGGTTNRKSLTARDVAEVNGRTQEAATKFAIASAKEDFTP